jgi:DNA polymerase-3 subunit epsilon
MFDFLFSAESRRRKMLEAAPEGAISEYLSAPLIDRSRDIHAVPLLSLDFETSGLDASKDHIVSAGYVAIEDGMIQLSTARHELVKLGGSLTEQSVVIHKITDDDVSAGLPLDEVVGNLLHALAGKIMVAHHAKIELTFLTQACQKLYGVSPRFPVIDTMRIAKQWLERRNKEIEQGDLRLFNLRKRYGLPMYQAHNALSDAIATAELLQAQIGHMDSSQNLPLKQFLS